MSYSGIFYATKSLEIHQEDGKKFVEGDDSWAFTVDWNEFLYLDDVKITLVRPSINEDQAMVEKLEKFLNNRE